MNENFEIINAYSRKQALEDGLLHNISDEIAKKAYFRIPIAVTKVVWDEYIHWTEEDNEKQTYQDEIARLWDVLFMAFLAIKLNKNQDSNTTFYKLDVIPRDAKSIYPQTIKLKFISHSGDNGEHVGTIMLANED